MALDLADHFFAALPELRYHPTAKRIRAFHGGEAVVDSTRAWIVWEPRRIVPVYAVPPDDIRGALVENTEEVAAEERAVQLGDRHAVLDPRSGFAAHTTPGQTYDITTDAATLTGAAFVPRDPDLAGYAVLDFEAFDEWREEDELLVAHARDPFKSVDTRHSSRRVVVEIGGVTVADSTRSTVLFETYLPTRYYLPREDVRMDLLHPTETITACAYKGVAAYWTATVGATVADDVAWSIAEPHNYGTSIKDMLAFFNERVDITIDDEPLERPLTPWS